MHRYIFIEKRQPCDKHIRVPLIVRGPGISSGKTTDHIALNIDLVSLKAHRATVRIYCICRHRHFLTLLAGAYQMTWMECH